jgi:hypothetical protein
MGCGTRFVILHPTTVDACRVMDLTGQVQALLGEAERMLREAERALGLGSEEPYG